MCREILCPLPPASFAVNVLHNSQTPCITSSKSGTWHGACSDITGPHAVCVLLRVRAALPHITQGDHHHSPDRWLSHHHRPYVPSLKLSLSSPSIPNTCRRDINEFPILTMLLYKCYRNEVLQYLYPFETLFFPLSIIFLAVYPSCCMYLWSVS